jgi:hypothetical protein
MSLKLTSTAALASYVGANTEIIWTLLCSPTWLMDLIGRPLRCVAELTPGMELSMYVVTWNCMAIRWKFSILLSNWHLGNLLAPTLTYVPH